MSIAIIGSGNMGKGLAARLSSRKDVTLATRATTDKAIRDADIIVLAVPYAAALEIAARADLSGKIVIDMTNALNPDFSGLLLGHTSSAAEEIQSRATGAKVVKAFNTIFASLLGKPASATANIPVFLAGNDGAAVDTVADLVKQAGFTPEKTGTLDAARLIEPLGMLNIRFGYGLGKGTDIAPTWVTL